MRKLLIITALLMGIVSHAQTGNIDFSPNYPFFQSASKVQDKVFYFLTLLEGVREVKACILRDSTLRQLSRTQLQVLEHTGKTCKDTTPCYTEAITWSDDKINKVQTALGQALAADKRTLRILAIHMRQSGYFELYRSLNDREMVEHAWKDAAAGLNHIINAYLFNKDLPYPKIDSASYDVNSKYYKGLFYESILTLVQYELPKQDLFFQPSLSVALQLLAINNRDEAIRYDPVSTLHTSLPAAVAATKWNQYPYSAILVLGEGPETDNIPISPYGKLRCMVAAADYKKGKAPFIIVSGGHVHPFHTPYSEAVEMRRFLIETCHIPAEAILTDPYARHTTTNFRNANRILYRNGFPTTQKLLCITSKSHADYIMDARFPKRCMIEIKHLPFQQLERLTDFEMEYLPVKESLHMNTLEPLDP